MSDANRIKAQARRAYLAGNPPPSVEHLCAADLEALGRADRYRVCGEPGARALVYDPGAATGNATPSGHRPKGVRNHPQAASTVAELQRLLRLATHERVLTQIANELGVSTRTVCRWRDGRHWPEKTVTLAAITAARSAMHRH